MKKKIFISLSIVSVAAIIAASGTIAYFSDTETSTENVITAGTIDIEVDGENPWQGQFVWNDVKPGDCKTITMNVKNIGENPVKLWKIVKCLNPQENGITEPEQDWYDNNGGPKNDIQSSIVYEMFIDGNMVINREAGITLDQIADNYIGLLKLDKATDPGYSGPDPDGSGILNPGGSVVVEQTYCLKEGTTNWAQSDILEFSIEIDARQINVPEPLYQMATYDNKYNGNTWIPTADETLGLLKYDYQAPEFNYDFYATGLKNDEYCLIYAKDPDGNSKILIDRGTPNSEGKLNLIGSEDLGSIPHDDDSNSAFGAKIWLVRCSDYNEEGESVNWGNMKDYLYDNWPGFINYNKGERPNEVISCNNENGSSGGNNQGGDNGNVEQKSISLSELSTNSYFGVENFDYSQANVNFVYDTPANNKLTGTIEAEGLQPYTTYQVKFIGKPTCEYGSDGNNEANEYIGYKGRWTCLNCSCSGSGCNRGDSDYENNNSECIAGYLVWDFFTTDENGDATKLVTTDNSYHVLHCNGGTCGVSNDNQLQNSDCSGTNPDYPYCNVNDVEGELERPESISCGSLTLNPGTYNLQLVITEESFHTDCRGTWTTVMGGDIEFEIE
jgi:predicted ribosomally synthesized peptide with SipW-like signal peptide